jgi:hypothetical protein
LKKWLLQDTLFDDLYGTNSPSSTWRVVERIGFLNDFPFTPNISILEHQCYIPTETVDGYNLCYYSDNTYSYSVPCAVGINKKIRDKKITIYPSPANDVLNISIPDLNTSIEIIVTNIMGEIVNHHFLLKENLSLLVANLPVGFYFLSCTTPQYNITTPFIINR